MAILPNPVHKQPIANATMSSQVILSGGPGIKTLKGHALVLAHVQLLHNFDQIKPAL